MVDYVPVLANAVAALDPNTSEARRAVYDRARRALIDGLSAGDRTLSADDVSAEQAKLEDAIGRVETGMVHRAVQFQRPPTLNTYVAPEGYGDIPTLYDSRKLLRLGAAGALGILLIGVAAYSFWPAALQSTPSAATSQAVSKTDQPQAAATDLVYSRQLVYYRTFHPVGTIVVDKSQSFLYVIRPNVSALRYGIGVGPECTASAGLYRVARKEEWPGWQPTSQSSGYNAAERMKNPLGARALYLDREYRIHGTNLPNSIGRHVQNGCIRLVNDDVITLYNSTSLESRVVVLN